MSTQMPGITAANASGIVDGAAALVITSARHAEKRDLRPMGRLAAWATVGVDPDQMGIGPVPATRAAQDAATMVELADRAKTAAFKAQARNRLALAQMRSGEIKAALASATVALKAARQSKRVSLEAMSLFRLAEAQFRQFLNEQAIQNATKAAELFGALGDPSGQGRALWAVAAASSKDCNSS